MPYSVACTPSDFLDCNTSNNFLTLRALRGHIGPPLSWLLCRATITQIYEPFFNFLENPAWKQTVKTTIDQGKYHVSDRGNPILRFDASSKGTKRKIWLTKKARSDERALGVEGQAVIESRQTF